jgi:sodium transport system ATP-binding protein
MAVDVVSFACQDGEVFGLLEPNGAGRTTLLRWLATVPGPTAAIAPVDGPEARGSDSVGCVFSLMMLI